jgi:hypothetical protein
VNRPNTISPVSAQARKCCFKGKKARLGIKRSRQKVRLETKKKVLTYEQHFIPSEANMPDIDGARELRLGINKMTLSGTSGASRDKKNRC